jgi:nitrous oxidase accessory protein
MASYPTESATITVGPGDSIQAAIDRAHSGDEIDVQHGVYRESINVTKQVILKGTGSVLDAGAKGNGITLREDGIILSGLDVRTTRRSGIEVISNNDIIKNIKVSGCIDGIRLDRSRNSSIAFCSISNNTNGIILFEAQNNIIKNNNINYNNVGEGSDCGISLTYSYGNTILHNNFADNGDSSISLRSSGNNSIMGNNVSKNDWYGISLEEFSNNNQIANNIVISSKHGGIYLDNSRDNAVRGNVAKENGRGIYLSFNSNDNFIEDNTVMDNEKGIHLAYHSSNNTITNNKAINNSYGIYFTFSAGWNRIFNNHLIDNMYNAYDRGLSNYWDNGTVGNYYSDLGLMVYIPGGNGVDRHPRRIA